MHEVLGHGVYDISEAARLVQMPVNTLRSWFAPSTTRQVFLSDYAWLEGFEKSISFLDLIDAWVVRSLRVDYKIHMSRIREVFTVLQKELDTEHPFSHQALYVSGKDIFCKHAGNLYEVMTRQGFDQEVMREHLRTIDYSNRTHLAERWRIAADVVVSPEVAFGKPTIAGTGINTYVVANAYWANDEDADYVADWYDITPAAVLHAVAFEKERGAARAAA